VPSSTDRKASTSADDWDIHSFRTEAMGFGLQAMGFRLQAMGYGLWAPGAVTLSGGDHDVSCDAEHHRFA
jgi:hypothetical protein